MTRFILSVLLVFGGSSLAGAQTKQVEYKANHFDVMISKIIWSYPQILGPARYDHTEDMLRFKGVEFTPQQAVEIYRRLREIPGVSNVIVRTNGVISYNSKENLTDSTSAIVGEIIANSKANRVGPVGGFIQLTTFEDGDSIPTRWRILSDK